jgi:hypothetical protein
MKFLFKIACLLLILSFYFCEKTDDFNKLKVDYPYKGSFSIAIGDTSLNLPNNGYGLPEGWQNLPETMIQNIDSFPLRSEISFSFIKPISNLNYIKRLILRIQSKNEFPAEIHLRFYFFTDGEILDSLTETVVVPKAIIGADSLPVQKGEKLQDIEIAREHFERWLSVNNILVSAYIINNPEAIKYIRFFNNYKLEMDMGFRVDFDFTYQKTL